MRRTDCDDDLNDTLHFLKSLQQALQASTPGSGSQNGDTQQNRSEWLSDMERLTLQERVDDLVDLVSTVVHEGVDCMSNSSQSQTASNNANVAEVEADVAASLIVGNPLGRLSGQCTNWDFERGTGQIAVHGDERNIEVRYQSIIGRVKSLAIGEEVEFQIFEDINDSIPQAVNVTRQNSAEPIGFSVWGTFRTYKDIAVRRQRDDWSEERVELFVKYEDRVSEAAPGLDVRCVVSYFKPANGAVQLLALNLEPSVTIETGICKWFNPGLGKGYIRPNNPGARGDVFVRTRDIVLVPHAPVRNANTATLEAGDVVHFIRVSQPEFPTDRAIRVTRLQATGLAI